MLLLVVNYFAMTAMLKMVVLPYFLSNSSCYILSDSHNTQAAIYVAVLHSDTEEIHKSYGNRAQCHIQVLIGLTRLHLNKPYLTHWYCNRALYLVPGILFPRSIYHLRFSHHQLNNGPDAVRDTSFSIYLECLDEAYDNFPEKTKLALLAKNLQVF